MHKLLIPLAMIIAITAMSWWLLYGTERTPAADRSEAPVFTPTR